MNLVSVMTGMSSYLGWKIDFANPKGEAAYCHPSSVAWRVYKNPIALGIGGVAAVLLEFADARIRSGVWDHSTYKADPIGRSKRTGIAAMVGVYGPASAARRVIQGVTNMHSQVKGETPNGEAYQALDVELLDWVAATAGYGFLNAYDRFVAGVSEADKSRFYREGSEIGALYGVRNPLRSTEDFMAMMDRLAPRFEPHPIVDEFLAIIVSGQAAPAVPKFLHRALAKASVSLLPPIVRQRLGLGSDWDLTWAETTALKAAGKLAERVPVPGSPAWDAALRLGLPGAFVWRGEKEKARLIAAAGLDAPPAMAA